MEKAQRVLYDDITCACLVTQQSSAIFSGTNLTVHTPHLFKSASGTLGLIIRLTVCICGNRPGQGPQIEQPFRSADINRAFLSDMY